MNHPKSFKKCSVTYKISQNSTVFQPGKSQNYFDKIPALSSRKLFWRQQRLLDFSVYQCHAKNSVQVFRIFFNIMEQMTLNDCLKISVPQNVAIFQPDEISLSFRKIKSYKCFHSLSKIKRCLRESKIDSNGGFAFSKMSF